MATLQKIRNHGVLLLVIVGLAMLAFIIGDFLNSGSTFFNMSRNNVATINGEKVPITDFQQAVDQMTEVYKIETGQSSLDENISSQIRTSVWETMVSNKILEKETAKAGLTVTADELSDHIIGRNIHPIVSQRRVFADENGRFNPQSVVMFLNSLQAEPANAEMREQQEQAKTYWMYWENALKSSLLQEKYTDLLTKAVTANSLEAKKNFEGRQQQADVAYVMQPYFAMPDTAVSVSEAEVKSLYAKRKQFMKQEPNRSISYVTFDIVPSETDFAQTEAWINDLKPEFDTIADVAVVVNPNSDVPYTGFNYSMENVPEEYKEFAFAGQAGDVTPVRLLDDVYTTARIMETGILTPDSVKLRHIYLAEDNQERADSIVNALKRGADFGMLALQYSAVQQTAQNGGEIGWVYENTLDREIADKAFARNAEKIFTVSNPGGIQIFRIDEAAPATRKVKLAILERKVTAGSRTIADIYNGAKRFASDNNSTLRLTDAAREQNLPLVQANQITRNADRVNQLEQSRPIVRWLFEAKDNEVSDVFECGNTFVVAAVTDVNDGEYRSLADAQPALRSELVRDKKAEKMMADMKAALGQNGTLETLAAALNTQVDTATAINFNSMRFGNYGAEAAVIGTASRLEAGKISEPVKGEMGVYVLQAQPAEKTEGQYDQASELMQLNMRTAYSLPYMCMQLLRDKAKLDDNRSTFY